MYNHGVIVQESATSVPVPKKNTACVVIAFGTAPVNLALDPTKATNKLFLCNSFKEAKDALGYSDDYEKYTLCQVMDAHFKVFGAAPVIFCNVLDPDTHKTAYTESIAVVNGQAVSKTLGVITTDLVLKNGSTALVNGTDYTAEFNDAGYLVVTLITEGVTTVSATGHKLDPAAVTTSDIIGSYNATTGEETGLELIRQVYPRFGTTAALIIAPGWSQNATVGVAMNGKCVDINGAFQAECVVDINTTNARIYSDVSTEKKSAGFSGNHMICVWPKVLIGKKEFFYSAVFAAMSARLDCDNDDVPSISPSNRILNVDGLVANGAEVILDAQQANALNAIGVVAAVNHNGIRSWGNVMAGYPDVTDPKDKWIICRRMFTWQGNQFVKLYSEKVDSPNNFRLVEAIVDAENIRGNSLVAAGKCAELKLEYRGDDNSDEDLLRGKVTFRQHFAPFTPAEQIVNVIEFDVNALNSELGGK